MPIALGAMNKATVAVDGTGTTESNASRSVFTTSGAAKTAGPSEHHHRFLGDTSTSPRLSAGCPASPWVGANNMLNLATDASITAETTDAEMIAYATANPTKFIYDATGKYANYDWVMKKNDHLWGNGSGYSTRVRLRSTSRSTIRAPAGYRVAPKDLWNRFTVDGGNYGSQIPTKSAMRRSTPPTVISFATQRGYFFYYSVGATALPTSIPLRAIATARPVRWRMSAPAVKQLVVIAGTEFVERRLLGFHRHERVPAE